MLGARSAELTQPHGAGSASRPTRKHAASNACSHHCLAITSVQGRCPGISGGYAPCGLSQALWCCWQALHGTRTPQTSAVRGAYLAVRAPGLVAALALQVVKLDGAELVRGAADVDDPRRPVPRARGAWECTAPMFCWHNGNTCPFSSRPATL